MFLVELILVWCAVFALWWYMKPRRPSPPVYPGALPIIGHAHLLLGDITKIWQKEIEGFRFCMENGGVIEWRLGPKSMYVVTDLDDCLTIANTCLDKPYVYDFGKKLYNRGLVTANTSTWKSHRKMLNPAFNQQIINTFVQEYSTQGKSLVNELASKVGKDPFDVVPYLTKIALRSVYSYKSMLDQLLDLGENQVFTDEEIREHLDTMIGAAYDTSTMTLTFALVLIGSYPNVQARIWKELQEVLNGPETDVTRHDLPKLVYLEAVIKETLRLYTPVPRIGRCSKSAVQLIELILIWCAVFALWWYVKPRRPSPPVYPGALPIIGHAHQLLGDISIWWFVKPRRPSPPVYPGALPIIGHAHQLLGSELQLWQTEKEVYHFCLENGGVVEVRLGPRSVYIVTDLDDCLTVANTCLEKPYLYDFGKPLYDRGLVTANALTWKPHRKLLNPAFSQQILNTFVQEYSEQARCLVTELATEAGKDPFDVVPYLLKNVIKSLYKTVIGVKPSDNAQEMTLKTYAHATDCFFGLLEDRFQSAWLHLPVLFNMSYLKKKQDAIVKTLKNITETIIMKRKSERKQNLYVDSIKEVTSDYKSLLDLLLDVGEKEVFTDEEIREHLDTIIGAAYDSTTRAMTVCLILIGTYPKVQARILEELQEVFDDSDRDLTRHDLPKLVYLEAVLKETLRLYPSVPRVGRYSESTVQLKHYTLPAGTTFILSLYAMNRHPVWGADANEFKPERWLNPDTLPDHPNAYATFSIGKRNCIALTWKSHRKMLNPAFNQQIINTFVQEYSTQGKSLVTELASKVGKDPFDVVPYLTKIALRSVYKTMIGVNPNDENQERIVTNYGLATDSFFASSVERFRSIWLHLPVFYNMSGLKKKQDELINTLINLSETTIRIRKSELKQNLYSDSIKEATSGYKSMLDQLLDLGENQVFTDEEIREHLDTMIGAAYDTSTMTLTFALVLIGSYPNVQARIWKEYAFVNFYFDK
ncbi:hypothetical protein PYW07_010035 [Mythimna separata]|uniref:Cytochrome P450 n=1 Tax=Mythimna separata TaxID=271217 RepID=A0AAD7YHX0_MYTSE|nr:hypothetical protein PYW07_010035 [Mythimna separata]